ncbi:MAG: helix-turn-helix transcriptional regulator [Candidatus Marinimicrobia bacterium]|nr:helix-turn-helix transcriptional regulator [Candidatus Neomarinimicrobiota bacterium]
MRAKDVKLRPQENKILELMGENIKLARLRRRLTAEQISERANISRSTLWHVEKGSEHIGIGTILKVLSVLGLEKSLQQIAENDLLGRKLQDAQLTIKKRGNKSNRK